MLRTVDISAGSLFRTFNLHPLLLRRHHKGKGRGEGTKGCLGFNFRPFEREQHFPLFCSARTLHLFLFSTAVYCTCGQNRVVVLIALRLLPRPASEDSGVVWCHYCTFLHPAAMVVQPF